MTAGRTLARRLASGPWAPRHIPSLRCSDKCLAIDGQAEFRSAGEARTVTSMHFSYPSCVHRS
jgi:hypothetical protein